MGYMNPIGFFDLLLQGDRMKMVLELASIDEIHIVLGYRFQRSSNAAETREPFVLPVSTPNLPYPSFRHTELLSYMVNSGIAMIQTTDNLGQILPR
jgi:hypothetical protein